MKIFITLDDKNGMAFNKRRQSRDAVLNRKIAELIGENPLFMSAYTEKLFDEIKIEKSVSENFLELASKDDFCFVEDKDVPIEKCEKLFIFRWNRVYPADRFFNHDLTSNGFILESSEEFVGSSHEKITLDIFTKGE